MKFILTLFLGLVALSRLSAQPPAPAADADYEAFQALDQEKIPGSPKVIGSVKYFTWLDAHRQTVKSAALAFQAAYPDDPRRWELLLASVKQPPLFIKGFGPDVEKKGWAAIIADENAVAAWHRQSEALTQALLASADASPAVRESAEWSVFARDFRAASAAKGKGEPSDYDGFHARFDAHVAKYAPLDILADRAVDYLGTLEKFLPGSTESIWRELRSAPNAALRAKADERVKLFETVSQPLDLAFIAADGRRVDLKSLRGKVVLLDFWATWCGPCIAELPNVVANYRKYHDKGFEVVGISLENAKLTPKDTAEQAAAKLAKAKKVLADFTAANDMPWPQYFDGKWWKTDIAVNYFIDSIPAMFLLDQDGKIVSTSARGEKLEAEVKRLLKL